MVAEEHYLKHMEILSKTEDIEEYVDKMLPSIAAYFTTSMGIPFDAFQEKVESMNLAQQYLFVLQQIKNKHHI